MAYDNPIARKYAARHRNSEFFSRTREEQVIWLGEALFLLLVIAAAGLSTYVSLTARLENYAVVYVASIVGLVIASALYGRFAHRRRQALAASRRDGWAEEVYAECLAGRELPFVLYLRPFTSTNELVYSFGNHVDNLAKAGFAVAAASAGAAAGLGNLMPSSNRYELEKVLRETFWSTGMLVALGRHGEHDGAGRIETTDSNWKNAVQLLIEASTLIVLVPSTHGGTLWEVEQLVASPHLYKTIILDMPDRRLRKSSKYRTGDHWSEIQELFRKYDRVLPPHNVEGSLVAFSFGGEVLHDYPLDLNSGSHLSKFARKMDARLYAYVKQHRDAAARAEGSSQ